ncbi:MAG: glycosyltransferase family 1 protein [Eubacterium sp.]
MDNKKTRVLIVTSPINIGGYDIVATNLQKNLDPNKFECTYCVRGDEIGVLEPEVIKNGARVIHQPDSEKNYFKSYFYYKRLFKENDFDVVHSHLMFYSGIVMRAAYKCGIPKRIPHSHMTDPCMEHRSLPKRIAAKLYSIVMKRWMIKYSTDLIACGPEAGEYLYGKKAFRKKGILLNNGTYPESFAFDAQVRCEVRKELGIEGKIVIGHVSRLNYVKNHKFLLDVFYEFQKEHPDSVLLIVGDGEERENIENKAKRLGISSKIIITGIRRDVPRLLTAMDVFVFPSLHEGLPMTLVEAQASKLPCLIADTVSKSAKLIDEAEYLPLEASPREWAQRAYALSLYDREKTDLTRLMESYDIKSVAKKLEKIYLS